MTIEWSQFNSGTPVSVESSDIIVGLRSGVCFQFLASSIGFNANNLSDVASPLTAFNNISPLTTQGDLLYFTGSNNARLPIGITNKILSVVGGLPAWVTFPGLLSSNNLSDVVSLATSQVNLKVGFIYGSGSHSVIGGNASTAAGSYGFAFGNTAISSNSGSVVWGDSNASPNVDTLANQFNLTFANGYRFFGGSLNIETVGRGLCVKEGSNAKQGVVTLVSGVGVVSNTSITANSRIFFSPQDTNTTGFLIITSRTTSSGFTITSSVLSDSGVIAYQIFEPAS
jgi:hypothetical protein